MRELYSAPEIARMFGIDRHKVYSLLKTGVLHGVLIGKRLMVTREAVDEFKREWVDSDRLWDLSNESKMILAMQLKKKETKDDRV